MADETMGKDVITWEGPVPPQQWLLRDASLPAEKEQEIDTSGIGWQSFSRDGGNPAFSSTSLS